MGAPPNDWAMAFAWGTRRRTWTGQIFRPDPVTAATAGSLGEFDVAAPFQKSEIPDEIEVRRADFKAGQTDHFGKISLTVAPIQRPDGYGRPCAGGVPFTLVRR